MLGVIVGWVGSPNYANLIVEDCISVCSINLLGVSPALHRHGKVKIWCFIRLILPTAYNISRSENSPEARSYSFLIPIYFGGFSILKFENKIS